MDLNTFGDSPAEIVLAHKLTKYNNKVFNSRVSRILGTFNGDGLALSAMWGPGGHRPTKSIMTLKIKTLLLLYQDQKRRTKEAELPEEIRTYTLNALARRYRQMHRILFNMKKHARSSIFADPA